MSLPGNIRHALIQELNKPHGAERTLALEEFLLAWISPEFLEECALNAGQSSIVRASMAGLLGRVALIEPARRDRVRAVLLILAADADPRINITARDAPDDLESQ